MPRLYCSPSQEEEIIGCRCVSFTSLVTKVSPVRHLPWQCIDMDRQRKHGSRGYGGDGEELAKRPFQNRALRPNLSPCCGGGVATHKHQPAREAQSVTHLIRHGRHTPGRVNPSHLATSPGAPILYTTNAVETVGCGSRTALGPHRSTIRSS